MSRFNSVATWFGCFFLPSESAWGVLEEIRILMSKDWFHADISKDEAEKRLQGRPAGTFLVRISSTTPEFPYTISMINNQHRRIQHTVGGDFSFKGIPSRYSSLIQLVDQCAESMELTIPCSKDYLNNAWGYA